MAEIVAWQKYALLSFLLLWLVGILMSRYVQFIETAAEWWGNVPEGQATSFVLCSILLIILVPLVGFALRKCCRMFRRGGGEQADMHRTLEEIKELLKNEQQEFYVTNPQSLERLDPSVRERIAEEQQLFDYYRKRCGEEPSLVRTYSLYSNVFFWLFLLLCVVFTKVHKEEGSGLSSLEFYLLAIAGGCCPICYVLVLAESFNSREKEYLQNMGDILETWAAIDRMVALEPELAMTAVAWHTVQRTEHVSRQDAQGNIVHSMEPRTEIVVTARKCEFIPIKWRDVSVDDLLLGVAHEGITTLFVESLVCTGDVQSSKAIDSIFGQFKEEYKDLDAFVDFDLNYQIPGLEKRLTLCRTPSPPWWTNLRIFYLASLVGMTWIYRLGLKMTASTSFVLVKQVFFEGNPGAV